MAPKFHFEQVLRSAAISAARKSVGSGDHSADGLPECDSECLAQVHAVCGGEPCEWQTQLASNCFTEVREQLFHNTAKADAFVCRCQQLFLHRIASRLCKHKLDMNQVYQVFTCLLCISTLALQSCCGNGLRVQSFCRSLHSWAKSFRYSLQFLWSFGSRPTECSMSVQSSMRRLTAVAGL